MDTAFEKNSTCCFSGHRNIPRGVEKLLYGRLLECVDALVKIGVCNFLSGGALGFDRMCEKAVLEIKKKAPHIRLTIVIPCGDQHKRWSEGDKAEYERMRTAADNVICLNERYVTGCMHNRNRFMVERSEYCVCYYTGQGGGTRHAVNLAREMDRDVINLA